MNSLFSCRPDPTMVSNIIISIIKKISDPIHNPKESEPKETNLSFFLLAASADFSIGEDLLLWSRYES